MTSRTDARIESLKGRLSVAENLRPAGPFADGDPDWIRYVTAMTDVCANAIYRATSVRVTFSFTRESGEDTTWSAMTPTLGPVPFTTTPAGRVAKGMPRGAILHGVLVQTNLADLPALTRSAIGAMK